MTPIDFHFAPRLDSVDFSVYVRDSRRAPSSCSSGFSIWDYLALGGYVSLINASFVPERMLETTKKLRNGLEEAEIQLKMQQPEAFRLFLSHDIFSGRK